MVVTKIRKILRDVDVLYRINATLRASATKRDYRQLSRMYDNQPLLATTPRLPASHLPKSNDPEIFFVGTDEQQDRSGLLQALEKLGRVYYFTRSDGSYGQNDPRGESIRRFANAERLWDLVVAAAKTGKKPDILIAQTWATLIDPSVFSRIRSKFGTLIVNIGMDDRHQFRGHRLGNSWSGTLGLIGHIDLALTAAPECVDWYLKEGCPAIYFPEASDPEIFHPMPELPKIHDVSFVGANYGIRRDLVGALRAAGVQVAAFGQGWERGRIDTADVPRLFAQSRIVLGVGTIGHCRDFYALKMRDFDGPMSGSLYLTHDNPDLATLFELGREIATYRDIKDCVARVRLYLRESALRESVAAAGRARAVRDHTWDRRFFELLAMLGLAIRDDESVTSRVLTQQQFSPRHSL